MNVDLIFMWIASIVIIIGFIISIYTMYKNEQLTLQNCYGLIISILGTIFSIGFGLKTLK
jgi:hypothetical protein